MLTATGLESLGLTLLAGFVGGAALVPICKRLALATNSVARPKGDRWHVRPTPLLGGVAIAGPTLIAGAWLSQGEPGLLVLLVCGLLTFGLGLTDDLLPIRPTSKLIAEICLASVLLFFGFRLGWVESMLLDALLTMIWIVGITNAFNLLDNMDGLCAGIAVIAGTAILGGTVFTSGLTPLAYYQAVMIGATLGFLLYNFYPASIFMGDSGSLFLGLNISALTLLSAATPGGRSSLLPVIVAPTMLLLIPIFDTALVTTLRILAGRRPSQGGKDHSSHRLVAIGLSERAAVLVLWSLAGLGGVVALGVRHMDAGWSVVLAATFGLAMVVFAVYLSTVRVYDVTEPGLLQRSNITLVISNFMYKRRVSEVLLDLCLISLSYYAAYRLRFEGDQYVANYQYFIQSLPIVIATQMVALFLVGGYRGVWRYFSLMDAVVFAKGVALATVAAQLVVLYLYRFEHYSRSVFAIHGILLLVLLATSRASFRLVGEFIERRRAVGRKCVIYGAGDAAPLALRELRAAEEPFRILGLIDDDPTKTRVRVAGYPVVGGFATLETLVQSGDVEVVVISTGSIDPHRQRELKRLCAARGVSLLRLHVDLQELVPPP